MRKPILVSVIDLIFIIVFNIVFFVIGGVNHIVATWIAYSFIHIGYIVLVLTPLITKNKKHIASLNMPIIVISSIYFLLQLLTNIGFIVFVLSSAIVALIVNIIILAIYLILLLSIIISNVDTMDQQERQKQDLKYIKECSSNLQIILIKVTDNELKSKIEKAYDIISTSQVKSNSSVYDVEIKIDNLIKKLKSEIAIGKTETAINIIDEIIDLANERNIILKALN